MVNNGIWLAIENHIDASSEADNLAALVDQPPSRRKTMIFRIGA
jgi:hypothetical protein